MIRLDGAVCRFDRLDALLLKWSDLTAHMQKWNKECYVMREVGSIKHHMDEYIRHTKLDIDIEHFDKVSELSM